ncbi:predicted DNA-binding protein with the Helix-hairpin-helix motif [Longilinea arvoryzae]|uniref:Predicted DNA-binding protein with the Helix-hairpin-helix motif n=1 Tax=Longilinea arvoryzae TaxID=360412 RepID=A0A0S7BKQ9_9CHLR|nr:radical SAM protein [Longilinea arvoryzae]GAP14818.1 predicted DNA-binding protein with the Helix-hairpin-helix motif [Longilinea arvoryzae]
MDTGQKIGLLTEHMALEPDGDSPLYAPPACDLHNPSDAGVIYGAAAGGRRVKLLKTLLTSACERDCYYCPFRAGRNFQRETMQPDELSASFSHMVRAGQVEGLFLSSALAGGGVKTQDRLIATAEILRQKHGFHGYLHLKIMPGAEKEQVLRAMQLADRVSINLEAPNEKRLGYLAPHKNFWEELFTRLRWVEDVRRSLPGEQAWKGHWPSVTTQFVVGAAGENDLELLTTSEYLFRQFHLARTYYSAFNPIPDTPLQDHIPENPVRQQRLYQASFLLRDYGFCLEDLPFEQTGFLPLTIDPKRAWAEQNLSEQPIDINRADRAQLLRVPGIGPKTADHLLSERHRNPLHTVSDLARLGIPVQKSTPFILLDGKRPAHQMSLW